MKKLLLVVFFFTSAIGLKAQSWVYHSFPTTTAVWRSNHSTSMGTDDNYYMQMQGDTILGSFSCKKVYSANVFSSVLYYNGALRQDIPNKKVYYTPSSGSEFLLHDFDLAVGDTILFDPGMSDTIYVGSIDSALVGANYHKVFMMASTNPYNDPADIIEGVGYTSDFFWRYEYTFENVWELRCFSVDNARLYPYPGMPWVYQCFMTVGIGELEEGILNILPNPITDMAIISVSCGDHYSIEVIGAQGELVHKNEVSGAFSKSVDFSEFDSGIYFVRLIDSKGNSVVKKIVKQ